MSRKVRLAAKVLLGKEHLQYDPLRKMCALRGENGAVWLQGAGAWCTTVSRDDAGCKGLQAFDVRGTAFAVFGMNL